MERYEHDLDTIELGVASEETRGDGSIPPESGGKLPVMTGIADDD